MNKILDHQWFAVQVTPGREKQVSDSLRMKGYRCLSPIQRVRRNTLYGPKEVEAPLFSGYLFCQLDLSDNRMTMLTTPNVRSLVSFGGRPIPLKEAEIKMLKRIVETGIVAANWPYLKEGNTVELISGPLAGLRGLLVSVREDSLFVVSIEMLQRSIAIKIRPEFVGSGAGEGLKQANSLEAKA